MKSAKKIKKSKPAKRKSRAVPKPKREVKPKSVGPGTKKFKFKPNPVQGKCDVLGCPKSAHKPKAFRCKKHLKAVRKAQLKANNHVWHKRVKDGTAGHHVAYTFEGKGMATKWTTRNLDRAVAQSAKYLTPYTKAQLVELSKKREKVTVMNKKKKVTKKRRAGKAKVYRAVKKAIATKETGKEAA